MFHRWLGDVELLCVVLNVCSLAAFMQSIEHVSSMAGRCRVALSCLERVYTGSVYAVNRTCFH